MVRNATCLDAVFLFIVLESFFTQVANWTKKHCYQDWVVERFGNDKDGNAEKRMHFVDVPPFDGAFHYPGHRHRADKEKKKIHDHGGFCHVLGGNANSSRHTLRRR